MKRPSSLKYAHFVWWLVACQPEGWPRAQATSFPHPPPPAPPPRDFCANLRPFYLTAHANGSCLRQGHVSNDAMCGSHLPLEAPWDSSNWWMPQVFDLFYAYTVPIGTETVPLTVLKDAAPMVTFHAYPANSAMAPRATHLNYPFAVSTSSPKCSGNCIGSQTPLFSFRSIPKRRSILVTISRTRRASASLSQSTRKSSMQGSTLAPVTWAGLPSPLHRRLASHRCRLLSPARLPRRRPVSQGGARMHSTSTRTTFTKILGKSFRLKGSAEHCIKFLRKSKCRNF
ncbi:hypothetical protein CYMTET_51542 [Cymbomonas tetramitiformis]|uniref:Uncharacterized protein n=1 Tax=Cymbomonas tetramitiformis TaxID=36881 RepID=A0AAE0ES07_9CHLO|nr:hypothetical protein CYMTET_51542 [Cymbomonas tetramitiformis]